MSKSVCLSICLPVSCSFADLREKKREVKGERKREHILKHQQLSICNKCFKVLNFRTICTRTRIFENAYGNLLRFSTPAYLTYSNNVFDYASVMEKIK